MVQYESENFPNHVKVHLKKIASAKTFFDGEKKLTEIAKKALSDIVNTENQEDIDKRSQ